MLKIHKNSTVNISQIGNTSGYDGHALRAYVYFGDQMPDIQNTVESINSISDKKHPHYHLRQDSKSPTFA